MVSYVKKLGDDTIAIVADPLHCSTKVSSDFCKHAEDIGADIISLIFRENIIQIYKYTNIMSIAQTVQK